MQVYKGDDTENKFINSGLPVLNARSFQKDLFFADAYQCQVLGDVLFDTKRSPLSNAIIQTIFRESFSELFQAFIDGGTFEAYLVVFRKIFGDDVDVDFTIPAPGKLQIDITATGFEISNFIVRTIVDNAYVFDNVVDEVGDNIVFQTIKGFETQYELEQMLFELVPSGIYTIITLDI